MFPTPDTLSFHATLKTKTFQSSVEKIHVEIFNIHMHHIKKIPSNRVNKILLSYRMSKYIGRVYFFSSM